MHSEMVWWEGRHLMWDMLAGEILHQASSLSWYFKSTLREQKLTVIFWFTVTQQFVPNYTASSKLFQRGRNTIFFRYLVIIELHLLSQERMLEPDHWSGIYGITPLSFPNCSAPGYIQARPMLNADHSATSTNYGYDQTPAPTGVLCCRIIAITVSICRRYRVHTFCSSQSSTVTFWNIHLQLMVLLVFRDALSVFLGDQDAYTVAMVTVRLWITSLKT